jgi:ketosteroid isomerase-like protein
MRPDKRGITIMGANTDIVKGIYAAFGEGRIGEIVARIADATDFIHHGGDAIPWSGNRTSPAAVAGFFQDLAAAVTVTEFTAAEYVETGDTVVALGRWGGVAKSTGKPFSSAWSMTWKLRDGKVYFYEAFEDTASIAKAFR